MQQIFANEFLQRPDWLFGAEFIAGLLLAVLITLGIQALGPIGGLSIFLVGSGGIIGSSYYFFKSKLFLVDPISPLIISLSVYVAVTFFNFLFTELERSRVRGAFAQYLSPEMVNRLAESSESLVLGGERKEMTFLFSDIRGFTKISEQYKDDPEGLTQLINELLTVLSNAILDHGGTIDKYMGDCIMAFWNAPMDDLKHAEDGCRSALAMVEAMAPLNARLEQEAKEEGRKHLDLKVGLGLNSGDAVVGNMGTAQRMDYSVLGDTVNTAARLEGQSKTYGVDIVLGPNTYEQVTQFAIIELDLIQVKGKTVGLQIYALLGDEEVAKDPAFISIKEAVSEMIQEYRNQAWDKAKELIQKIRDRAESAAEQEVGPIMAVKAASSDRFRLDVLCELYEIRIRQYESEPPPPDWDGVFIATTK